MWLYSFNKSISIEETTYGDTVICDIDYNRFKFSQQYVVVPNHDSDTVICSESEDSRNKCSSVVRSLFASAWFCQTAPLCNIPTCHAVIRKLVFKFMIRLGGGGVRKQYYTRSGEKSDIKFTSAIWKHCPQHIVCSF